MHIVIVNAQQENPTVFDSLVEWELMVAS